MDTQDLHPTMVLRNERLLVDCEARGFTIGASRITANYAQQKALYDAYRAGHGNLAANPDAVGEQSPWGWPVRGSYHQIQQDGWSHAVDYTITGCTWFEFHDLADRHGIRFPLFEQGLGEPWHAQWWDGHGIYPDHITEDDMTPDQLAQAFGGALDAQGRIVVPLADGNLYPLANVLGFIHGELTRDDLLPARIKRVLGT